MLFDDWIDNAWTLGASDLHLETDTPPVARVRGELQTVGGAVPGSSLVQAAQDLLGAEAWAQFRERGSADMSVAIGGVRCRANFYRTTRGMGVAVRLLAPGIKDLRGCNLHPDFRKLIEASTGLLIISGPTGSGKSTTLAALIEEINLSRARHIVTLESPLEYLYTNRRSFIRQREIPTHSPSFEQGIVDALRENPDVLVISEMRTPEVMRLTLNAAETGHLVLATMHSSNCAEALSRLCMSFPEGIQGSVRAQLADCLVAVCCQRLEFLSTARLHVPRCEILLPTSVVLTVVFAFTNMSTATGISGGAYQMSPAALQELRDRYDMPELAKRLSESEYAIDEPGLAALGKAGIDAGILACQLECSGGAIVLHIIKYEKEPLAVFSAPKIEADIFRRLVGGNIHRL